MYKEDTMLTAVHRVSVHVYVAHKCPCNLTTVPSKNKYIPVGYSQ